MNGIKYDRRKVTISLLLLIIISFCIQVSGNETSTRVQIEPSSDPNNAPLDSFSSQPTTLEPDTSIQEDPTIDPSGDETSIQKPSQFRKFQGFGWFQELLEEFSKSASQWVVTQNPAETTTNNPDETVTEIPTDPSTTSGNDTSQSQDNSSTTTLDPSNNQQVDNSTFSSSTTDLSLINDTITSATMATTIIVASTISVAPSLKPFLFKYSCEEDTFTECEGLCAMVNPEVEPEDSPLGFTILVCLVGMFLLLIAAILAYTSFMISSMKKKREAETAARLLELAAERRQKIEEHRRSQEVVARVNSKEEKTQNNPEDEIEEPPRNDVRERLMRLKEYKERMDAMEKSDTRSSKFEQRGPLYIPGRLKLSDPDPAEDCAPEIILERVYYEPAGNEMFDIGTDVEIVGSDRSASRKQAKQQTDSKKGAGSKEKKEGSKEGSKEGFKEGGDDKTLELI